MKTTTTSILLLSLALLGACAESHGDLGALTRSVTSLKVAGIQYSEGRYAEVDPTCSGAKHPDVCAVQKLVEQAAGLGAKLIVTPEYGLGQQYLEPTPELGEVPADSSSWDDDDFIKMFSKQAKQLGVYVAIDLQTYTGQQPGLKKHNSLVAFGPGGKVLARHHKFELFDSEAKSLTPGTDVTTFETPLGKVGLLICADLYGDLRLHDRLTRTLGARVVLVSSFWTAPAGLRWQQSFAKNWGVYVVGSNVVDGAGHGAGVFGPNGEELAVWDQTSPKALVAEVPQP